MPLSRTVGNYFDSSGSFIRRVERWAGPTSYVTGGEVVTPSVFGLGTIIAALFGVASDGTSTRLVWWNPTTNRLMWFVPNTNVEVANGTNLSTFSAQYEVIGQ